MILQVEKRNDPIIQAIKQRDPRLYEALRKPDRIDVPLQEVHVFGVSGDVSVVTDGFPPLTLSKDVRLDLIQVTFKIAPTGADFKADIRKRSHGNTILKAPIIFPISFTGVIERAEFGIDTFSRGDVLIADILQIGSVAPGTMLTMYMAFTLL